MEGLAGERTKEGDSLRGLAQAHLVGHDGARDAGASQQCQEIDADQLITATQENQSPLLPSWIPVKQPCLN